MIELKDRPPLLEEEIEHVSLEENFTATESNESDAPKNFSAVKVLIFSVSWFATSISLTLYNKFLFGSSYTPVDNEEVTRFYPFLTTSLHTALQFLLCTCVLCGLFYYIYSVTKKLLKNFCLQNSYQSIGSETALNTTADNSVSWPKIRNYLFYIPFPSKETYLKHTIPCALATALDIGLSNMAMEFITVSLHTMLKSTAPMFVLLVAFFLRLEKPQLKLFLIILLMCFGVGLMLQKDKSKVANVNSSIQDKNNFEYFIGVLMVLIASLMAGVRVGLAQILLQTNHHPHGHQSNDNQSHDHGHHSSAVKNLNKYPRQIYTLFLLSPLMSISLFIISLITEHPFDPHFIISNRHGVHPHMPWIVSTLMMSAGGLLAFFMVFAEFGLLSITSAVFLSVTGIIKEIITISFGVLLFNDSLTWLNMAGLLISIIAIAYYNYLKFSNNNKA